MFADFSIVLTVYGLVLLILVTTVFLAATIKKDNSIMDIVYGPLFLVATSATILLLNLTHSLAHLMIGLVALWSLRLGVRIHRKNRGAPEDARYAKWRAEWQKQGQLYFLIRSYLQVNILQGVVILVVSLPIILALSYGGSWADQPLLIISTVIGTAVFITGLTLESIADYQLDRFIARKKAGTETATLMKTGLFRYSRRPNYFGESLIWWGMAIITLPLPFGWLALLSPITITYIVTRVTGPMLEKIFLERYPVEYTTYMKETSYFIPLPPKL
jgi:steroid 5-alpha reductase family enzyme